MQDVILSKILNGKSIRTDEVHGKYINYPSVGEPFSMIAESLSIPNGVRYVVTSDVQEVSIRDDCVIITTQNSVYRLVFTE